MSERLPRRYPLPADLLAPLALMQADASSPAGRVLKRLIAAHLPTVLALKVWDGSWSAVALTLSEHGVVAPDGSPLGSASLRSMVAWARGAEGTAALAARPKRHQPPRETSSPDETKRDATNVQTQRDQACRDEKQRDATQRDERHSDDMQSDEMRRHEPQRTVTSDAERTTGGASVGTPRTTSTALNPRLARRASFAGRPLRDA